MRIKITDMTWRERKDLMHAVNCDMEERGDLGCSRREWIADLFDEIRRRLTLCGHSLDSVVRDLCVGKAIRRHNRLIREKRQPLPYLDNERDASVSERANERAAMEAKP